MAATFAGRQTARFGAHTGESVRSEARGPLVVSAMVDGVPRWRLVGRIDATARQGATSVILVSQLRAD
jgi:hypothetical protein